MLSSTSHDHQKSNLGAARTHTVCVVDLQPDDYQAWRDTACGGEVRLHFVAGAEEALRLSRTEPIDLWVVNVNLQGRSGIELCGMLKSRCSSTPLYVVANEYSQATERAAWGVRATLFGCKPAHVDWLTAWCADRMHRSPVGHQA